MTTTNETMVYVEVYGTRTTNDLNDIRDWAIRAAWRDTEWLITPQARERALKALDDFNDPYANAARTTLLDGGAWQGDLPKVCYATPTAYGDAVRVMREYMNEERESE